MLQLGNSLFQGNDFAPAFLGFMCACFLLGLLGWTIVSAFLDAIARAKRMHQIPCANCRFFTNDYRLKCTMNPYIANTEKAIDCSDYISD